MLWIGHGLHITPHFPDENGKIWQFWRYSVAISALCAVLKADFMAHSAGEAETGDLRVDFDRRLRLEFHGSRITSDAGLLAFRELDDALGLTGMAGDALADSRTGRNSRHSLMAQFRQSVFGRLAGYEDVNDADRFGADPAMRWIVGGRP